MTEFAAAHTDRAFRDTHDGFSDTHRDDGNDTCRNRYPLRDPSIAFSTATADVRSIHKTVYHEISFLFVYLLGKSD